MTMKIKEDLVLWMCWCIFNIRSAELSNVSWPSSEKNISSMTLIGNGQKLIVSGLNHLYSLNTTNLQLINDVVIGPVGDIDNDVTHVIYNKTEPNNNAYIITCDTLNSYCEIRQLSDISEVVNRLEPPIKSEGVQALMTSFQKPNGQNRWDTFLFVACPHAEVQANRCSRPGIHWYTNSGLIMQNPFYGFKSITETEIQTEKYVDAFVVDEYRLFFSLQKTKSSQERIGRITQVCLYFTKGFHANRYTTPLTYADMPIECGHLKEIQAVKKIMFEKETVFVAVFNDSVKSSVCVYTMSETKRKFVENIKDCYNGKRVPEEEDYIKLTTTRPCNSTARENLNSKTDEYFLCNTDQLGNYHSVIGTHVLSKQPAVNYTKQLTALTLSVVDSKIIAFLGTESGDILKAVVYPSDSTYKVQQFTIPNIGSRVKKDMYTSSDVKHIFALSKTKVFKIPVQSCYEFVTCDKCLLSKDPYCGWCFLEERCSTRDACPENKEWISASSGDICPHVEDITPTVMSVWEIETLNITVSNVLQGGVNVSCLFHSDEIVADFNHIDEAEVSSDGLSVKCRPTNISAIEDKIKGSVEMKVAILANSSTTTINGTFTIYRCDTFERCFDCSAKNWSCKWCPFLNQCTNHTCVNKSKSINTTEDCPRTINYTVVTNGQDIVHDSDGSVYLSRGRSYTINITGINLLEPKITLDSLTYSCKIVVSGSQEVWFNRTTFNHGSLVCYLEKEGLSKITSQEGKLDATVQLMWGGSLVYGGTEQVIIYTCAGLTKPANNCGHCKSFELYQPHFNCQWCGKACVDSNEICNNTACDDPIITKVYPLSAHMNATTLIEITGVNLGSSFNETIDSVTVAGTACDSIESGYIPGIKIECELPPSNKVMKGIVIVTRKDNASGEFSSPFKFRVPTVSDIEPSLGPMSGGTLVTLYGQLLDTGREMSVSIGGKACKVYNFIDGTINKNSSRKRVCITTAGNINDQNKAPGVNVQFDGANAVLSEDVTYTYIADPEITSISPKESFKSGGRTLTIEGNNLHAIQLPKIYAMIGETRLTSENCTNTKEDNDGVIYCPSPRYTSERNRGYDRSDGSSFNASLGFEMDGVSSVKAENLSKSIAVLSYFEDPSIKNFTGDKKYTELISIQGDRLNVAANDGDVVIMIGCERCNITSMAHDNIICRPPVEKPTCINLVKKQKFSVIVNIGFLSRIVGNFTYNDPSVKPLDDTGRQIITRSVVGILIFGLLCIVFVMCRKRRLMKKEKAGLLYKMDKIEAKFRTQCREEFAALQTAVSDLTSDLRGGKNALFREYDVYASKTLFSSQKSDMLMNQQSKPTEQVQQALDSFKGLLRNRQFLLMLIKTLEKEQSFTINDKSNVATILMILNHDNMEYVTGILTTLLDDLIDKNIASGTPKLLLRRSECVAEKLLTHWLSICLYHYLKERSGSALYILYKAIKIQTEKGPMDYITNCGKYTLSEDKLITSADNEINPVTLTLDVTHFDFIDNTEKQISVQVLDCDTVTQAKAKMLEIFYKNVPYSQRPSVHSTELVVKEDDRGSNKSLSDDDDSSIKEGIWKRINTLQHYKIHNGAEVNLFLNKDLKESFTALAAGESPDSFIVSNSRSSKPIVRSVSGSNFWHLTKKHQRNDEVQLSSDLFLPRLLNTKGTLQTYIDDLFQAVLSVGEEPPIIIKFLFDYLDSAASRCGLEDPDVLHTWKCNSLLLRFWVNIIKNPEFVFDVHKPVIVDSCLSVVAQTLMDSCSTADLVLGPSSPSNKLLFAKDIPIYKSLVRQYFKDMKMAPAISDQELNSYLTQKVSQKFYGRFNQSSALMQMYEYAAKYRNEIYKAMNNTEIPTTASFSSLSSKLESVFKAMDS